MIWKGLCPRDRHARVGCEALGVSGPRTEKRASHATYHIADGALNATSRAETYGTLEDVALMPADEGRGWP